MHGNVRNVADDIGIKCLNYWFVSGVNTTIIIQKS